MRKALVALLNHLTANHNRQGLWVPAFVGTTQSLEQRRYISPQARQDQGACAALAGFRAFRSPSQFSNRRTMTKNVGMIGDPLQQRKRIDVGQFGRELEWSLLHPVAVQSILPHEIP
jgi:hypothetical protein